MQAQQDFRLGKQLLEAGHRIRLQLNSLFQEDDLTGLQARIIGYVVVCQKRGQNVYQKDLEQEFKIGRSSVTSVLNILEKNGFIRRQSAAHDARLKEILLTEKALQFGEQYRSRLDLFEQRLMAEFTAEELTAACKILKKINDALDTPKEDEQ